MTQNYKNTNNRVRNHVDNQYKIYQLIEIMHYPYFPQKKNSKRNNFTRRNYFELDINTSPTLLVNILKPEPNRLI